MIARPIVDFPEPDSPTMQSDSPLHRFSETPLTALTMPSGV
jgi:hypothetical protein